jgi:hypothetical protein
MNANIREMRMNTKCEKMRNTYPSKFCLSCLSLSMATCRWQLMLASSASANFRRCLSLSMAACRWQLMLASSASANFRRCLSLSMAACRWQLMLASSDSANFRRCLSLSMAACRWQLVDGSLRELEGGGLYSYQRSNFFAFYYLG